MLLSRHSKAGRLVLRCPEAELRGPAAGDRAAGALERAQQRALREQGLAAGCSSDEVSGNCS